MRHRHRPGLEGGSLALRFDGVNAELFEGATGREAGSLLCGDIRTEQGASIAPPRSAKGNRRQRVRDTIIMVTAGH
jgi:hypothetical protein